MRPAPSITYDLTVSRFAVLRDALQKRLRMEWRYMARAARCARVALLGKRLDELTEFERVVLAALRQGKEGGKTIVLAVTVQDRRTAG